MNTATNKIEDDLFEIVLKLTATAKNGGQTAFLIEVEQAGLFLLKGFEPKQLHYMLGAYCPNILFPYGREIISELVMKGGFPPLYLSPVNFDALYEHQLRQQQEKH